MKSTLNNIQFVFFLNRFAFGDNKASFLARFKEVLGEGNEVILPLPDDIPGDIPLLLLSQPDKFEIKFSKNRIDFTYLDSPDSEEDTETLLKGEVLKYVTDLFKQIVKEKIQVNKIGCVVRTLVEAEKINESMKKFFSDTNTMVSYENDSEIFVRFLRKSEIALSDSEKVKTNEIRTINTSALQIKTNERVMMCEFDINTFPNEDKLEVSEEKIKKFFEQMTDKNKDFLGEINSESNANDHE